MQAYMMLDKQDNGRQRLLSHNYHSGRFPNKMAREMANLSPFVTYKTRGGGGPGGETFSPFVDTQRRRRTLESRG
ncbi:hypothetical protein EVAR_19736_1 [Eumeta japonica]|uniref:Uncharacterized protein n=1 Tax=Eumeta variegata TaxID=151549 RepID=A0A4C1UQI1_EUMVA|nr:hypothetical protein EVAR_19736_1 [Eumeta japonica]